MKPRSRRSILLLVGGSVVLVLAALTALGIYREPATTPPGTMAGAPGQPGEHDEQVLLEGGCFAMGRPDGRVGETPVHRVCVASFLLDLHEVTVAQYRRCREAHACGEPGRALQQRGCTWEGKDSEDLPVTCVTWFDANGYCRFVGRELPTEAQWEFAARGPEGSAHPWGDASADCSRAVYSERYGTCKHRTPQAVCSRPAGRNPAGVCDLVGNAWEWVRDVYDLDFYARAPQQDPVALEGGRMRVVRGGGYDTEPEFLHAAYRACHSPLAKPPGVGFRCAAPITPAIPAPGR